VEIATDAGLAYELHIPLAVYEKLPSMGDIVSLHTHLVVKEDGWQLFGFGSSFEREVFRGTLEAKGVGPGLALGMLSALGAANLVRAIKDRNVALLITAPRVGKKKAEQIVLDLAERFEELPASAAVEPMTPCVRWFRWAIRTPKASVRCEPRWTVYPATRPPRK
jgi:Holliday junction DNA helicase RuvA